MNFLQDNQSSMGTFQVLNQDGSKTHVSFTRNQIKNFTMVKQIEEPQSAKIGKNTSQCLMRAMFENVELSDEKSNSIQSSEEQIQQM